MMSLMLMTSHVSGIKYFPLNKMKRGRKTLADEEIALSIRKASIKAAIKRYGSEEKAKKYMPELWPAEVAVVTQSGNSNLSKIPSKTDDSSEENENEIKMMKTHWFLIHIDRSYPQKDILCLFSLRKGI
jgi:uncharacterized protein YllA (UPF0747 family)